jgi:hypothetical protein
MATPERRPFVVVVTLELEDNCGAFISKRKKTIQVKIRDGDDDPPVPLASVIEEEFQRFVDGLPDTFEV